MRLALRAIRGCGMLLCSLVLAACGGGGGGGDSGPPQARTVSVNWTSNRESGVNSAGGGYEVTISGQAPVDVPYTSGPLAPTSTSKFLQPGTYTVTVRAYAALDPTGGTARTFSAPTQIAVT